MQLYNTLTRKKETFQPQDGKTVRMYVCGPTVYDHLHIGNVRPVIVFDTLRKYFERFKGWNVSYVQNITDVDDKLINRSIESGDSVETIAARYTEAYFKLLEDLGAKLPSHSPRATDHIAEMIELIKTLIEKELAYEMEGDVYYRVSAFEGYGKLSGRKIDDLKVGARITASEKKENPLDFTLWKSAKPNEPKWSSPWGEGRPGWHTECVVLSRKYLGETLDIHAGGNDLIFPHHENEIAQAEAVGKSPFARFWLHNGMLSFDGEKMSKSLGNFAYAHEVLESFTAETIRYFYLSRHYRKPLNYSVKGLKSAANAISRVKNLIREVEVRASGADKKTDGQTRQFLESIDRSRKAYVEAMDDDINTPGAIASIQEIVSTTNQFRKIAISNNRGVLEDAVEAIQELGRPLGLFQKEKHSPDGIQDELIRLLIDLRRNLREKKEFQLADEVRDRLSDLGIALKDGPKGTIWTRSD